MKILLAVDASAASEAALNFVIDEVKTEGTEVCMFHVLDPYPDWLAKRFGRLDAPDFAPAVQKQRAMASELLARTAETLRAAGFSVSSLIREGDARTLILQKAKAWRTDLIVIGSAERKGIRHFFSSSISEDVARDASCSVEVVRVAPWTRRGPLMDTEEPVWSVA